MTRQKTRRDQPHLEPLRYDYQLLHDCYRERTAHPWYQDLKIAAVMAAGAMLFFFGMFNLIYRP